MELLEHILKALVDNPSEVLIDQTEDQMGVLLTVSLNQADMGRIIGTKGATAQAIRRIISVWGMTHGQRISIKVNDPDGVRFEKVAL